MQRASLRAIMTRDRSGIPRWCARIDGGEKSEKRRIRGPVPQSERIRSRSDRQNWLGNPLKFELTRSDKASNGSRKGDVVRLEGLAGCKRPTATPASGKPGGYQAGFVST